jgi:DNA-binding CsgD family transcriptional regulator
MTLPAAGKRFGNIHWVPPWVRALGAPVWVTTDEGTLSYLNPRAEAVLGERASHCIGRPCHQVVCGYDEGGRPYCGSNCPVQRRARLGQDVEPVTLRVGGSGNGGRWVQVLPVAVHDPLGSGLHIVHCVVEEKTRRNVEDYLTRVAHRFKGADGSNDPRSTLTKREREILHLLAEDEPLHAIAARLTVSHATVRNHVQHILAKLRVHSTIEAVAWYLLDYDG